MYLSASASIHPELLGTILVFHSKVEYRLYNNACCVLYGEPFKNEA